MDAAARVQLYRILLALLIVAGWFFGLAPFLAPTQFASFFGFVGTDLFVYRIAGAATFGYGVGLLLGWRATWEEMRIPFIGVLVFNLCSIVTCILAILAGNAQWIVYVIFLASIVFVLGTAWFLMEPPVLTDTRTPPADHPLAQWVVGLYVIGTAAALFFGVVTVVLAGAFGKAVGAAGIDDFIYRQSGGATLGAGVGGIVVLMVRRWAPARIPTVMALVFNGLSVIAALIQITSNALFIAWVILAAAALVTIGTALALRRNGE